MAILPGRRGDGGEDVDGDVDEMKDEGWPVMVPHSHPPSRRKMLVTPDRVNSFKQFYYFILLGE